MSIFPSRRKKGGEARETEGSSCSQFGDVCSCLKTMSFNKDKVCDSGFLHTSCEEVQFICPFYLTSMHII